MDQETEHIVLPTDSTAQVLREIDAAIDGLERLSLTATDEVQFYEQLLCLVAGPIHARAGSVWQPGPMAKLNCLAVLNSDVLTQDTLRAEEKRLASLRSSFLVKISDIAARYYALSAAVRLGDELRRVLVLYVDADLPTAAQAGYLQYIDAIAEMASQFEQELDRRHLSQNSGELRSFEQLTLAMHRDWDLSKTCYAIANEGRNFLKCDRLSVATRIGRRFEISAVSGVDVIDRRSQVINTLGALVEAVAKIGETLIYDGDMSRLPRQIADPLRDHVDVSAAKCLVIVPLKRTVAGAEEPRPFAAIVTEDFNEKPSGRFLVKLTSLSEQAALAVGRVVQLQRAPLARGILTAAPLWRRWRTHAWSRWGVTMLCCTAIVVALWHYPASFHVTVRGEVRPASTKSVFATADGIVETIHVRAGMSVAQGQVIALLASKELELELQRVSGDLATATERLQAVDAERLQSRSGSADTRLETSRLAASELTLKSQIESLQKQLRLLQRQMSELELRSPIAGEILTEDVEMLLGRPVQRGQRLLDVADLDGPWKLRFQLPDRRSGHVLRALQEQPSGLGIRFVVANRPESEYVGTTTSVAYNTQLDANGSPMLPLEGTFDRGQVEQLRPGATVVGKIECGTRSLGFIWFHEIQEELRRRFF